MIIAIPNHFDAIVTEMLTIVLRLLFLWKQPPSIETVEFWLLTETGKNHQISKAIQHTHRDFISIFIVNIKLNENTQSKFV